MDSSNGSVAGWLYMFLPIYISMSHHHLPTSFSTVITHLFYNGFVKKVNHVTDNFTHKHTELFASFFSIICVLKKVVRD